MKRVLSIALIALITLTSVSCSKNKEHKFIVEMPDAGFIYNTVINYKSGEAEPYIYLCYKGPDTPLNNNGKIEFNGGKEGRVVIYLAPSCKLTDNGKVVSLVSTSDSIVYNY